MISKVSKHKDSQARASDSHLAVTHGHPLGVGKPVSLTCSFEQRLFLQTAKCRCFLAFECVLYLTWDLGVPLNPLRRPGWLQACSGGLAIYQG